MTFISSFLSISDIKFTYNQVRKWKITFRAKVSFETRVKRNSLKIYHHIEKGKSQFLCANFVRTTSVKIHHRKKRYKNRSMSAEIPQFNLVILEEIYWKILKESNLKNGHSL